MCGLFGFSRTTEITNRMTPTLAICMAGRGKDSWGVTDGDILYKTKGAITDCFLDLQLDGPLYHTRAASMGAVSDRNAHPFRFEHNNKVVIGAHNGHLSNHFAIKEKYNRKDVEVDSEHIFLHLAEGKPLSDIGGYGAVIWYEYPTDHANERIRYFSRFNHDALYFMKLKTGEIAFASTKTSLEMAAMFAGVEYDYFYETEPLVRYCIENDELVIVDTLDWSKAPLTVATKYVAAGHGQGSYYNSRAQDMCPVNGCTNRVNSVDDYICQTCFHTLSKDINGDAA